MQALVGPFYGPNAKHEDCKVNVGTRGQMVRATRAEHPMCQQFSRNIKEIKKIKFKKTREIALAGLY